VPLKDDGAFSFIRAAGVGKKEGSRRRQTIPREKEREGTKKKTCKRIQIYLGLEGRNYTFPLLRESLSEYDGALIILRENGRD